MNSDSFKSVRDGQGVNLCTQITSCQARNTHFSKSSWVNISDHRISYEKELSSLSDGNI